MKNKMFLRATAFMVSALMLLNIFPVGAFAASGFVSETHDVFRTVTSTIAPGITQSTNYAYAKDGKQMVYYVATADITREDVVVQTSYKEQYVNGQFGMEKLTAQMAYADTLYTDKTSDRYISEYYKAVVGVNASFYNMTTGQPSGVTYLDGIRIGTSGSYNQIFAILKDGTAVVDYTDRIDESRIWQSAAGSQMLVYNGQDVTQGIDGSYNTDRHSRTCVGVTADGKVVVMALDGRQEPFSCGGTMHELAQIMLEQGCVAAINLDGGGSTTFAARPEGEDEVKVINRPSDGSERSISSGLIIASLAVPSNAFDRAVLTAENAYVTPGSSVAVTAIGVSTSGNSADIPENAVWQLADSRYGTVEDGVFTSNGTVGTAQIQLTVDGAVVGSTEVHVVIPEALEFHNSAITVPYGKTVAIGLTATYGLNEVALKASDIVFTLDDPSIGGFDGLNFTAAAEGIAVTSSPVTASFTFAPTVTASSVLNLGKGSEIIADFEEGHADDYYMADAAYNYVWPEAYTSIVTAENGKVHSGDYAMKMGINYSNSQESGYQRNCLRAAKSATFSNATRVGMWIYIPDEAVGLWARWTIQAATGIHEDNSYVWSVITGQDLDGTVSGGTTGYVSQFQESGWHYLSIDTSAYPAVGWNAGSAIMQFYISDRDGSSFGYDASDYSNITGDFTFYVDDITVDYSDAVEDRDAPVFSSVVYADEFTSDARELTGQTTTSRVLSFTATVADVAAANATGLNAATARAYVDGVEVDFTYNGGKISITDVCLADGKHTVKFSICDNMGNYAGVIREITVNAASGMATVKLVPHDATLNRILHGSVYYMDLVATDIDHAKNVTVTMDLDSLSTWELDHMDLAEGFEATYSVDADENIATIVITRTGDVSAEGEAVLASLPVRVWQLKAGYRYENGVKAGKDAFTAKQFRDMKEFWRISLIATVDAGLLTNMDGTTSTFTGDRVFVDTESWAEDADMISTAEGTAYYNHWNGGHLHTAEAMDDKAATCTEDGYTGRTWCAVCNSVVDWGTTIPATGHSYTMVGETMECMTCGDKFSETYTGIVYDDVVGVYRYMMFGKLVSGWYMVGDDYYYFCSDFYAVTGEQTVNGHNYVFDEHGVLLEGSFHTTADGRIHYYWAGQWLKDGWAEINGKTYYFWIDGYAAVGQTYIETGSNTHIFEPYLFGDDGALIDVTGFYDHNGDTLYLEHGRLVYAGLIEIDGDYYYINSHFKAVTGNYYVYKTNGLLPEGYYTFDESGKMVVETAKDGIVEENGALYYYVDGIKTYAGLIEMDGDFYYVRSNCQLATGYYYVYKTNGLLPEGYYTFDESGKMVIEEAKDGIVEENGALYYYVDGIKTYAGFIEMDGDFYYVRSNCQLATGYYYVYKTNGLLPEGYYTFDENGKMIADAA